MQMPSGMSKGGGVSDTDPPGRVSRHSRIRGELALELVLLPACTRSGRLQQQDHRACWKILGIARSVVSVGHDWADEQHSHSCSRTRLDGVSLPSRCSRLIMIALEARVRKAIAH